MRILVFGASITWGAWDLEGGWVQRLRKFLDEKNLTDSNFYCILYNLGISGDITDDVIERFEFETKQRLKETEENIIIFSIGGNDTQWLNNENRMRTSEEKFKENILKLLEFAQKFAKKIIFVGLTPVDESKTTPIPWDTIKEYWNKNLQKYNEIIKTICKENDIVFVNLIDEWLQNYKKLLNDDGLHPNSEGHQKIFEKVKETLEKSNYLKE